MDKIKSYQHALFLVLFILSVVLGSACQRKVGCPGEIVPPPKNKNGKPKMDLFDKKASKKLGR